MCARTGLGLGEAQAARAGVAGADAAEVVVGRQHLAAVAQVAGLEHGLGEGDVAPHALGRPSTKSCAIRPTGVGLRDRMPVAPYQASICAGPAERGRMRV